MNDLIWGTYQDESEDPLSKKTTAKVPPHNTPRQAPKNDNDKIVFRNSFAIPKAQTAQRKDSHSDWRRQQLLEQTQYGVVATAAHEEDWENELKNTRNSTIAPKKNLNRKSNAPMDHLASSMANYKIQDADPFRKSSITDPFRKASIASIASSPPYMSSFMDPAQYRLSSEFDSNSSYRLSSAPDFSAFQFDEELEPTSPTSPFRSPESSSGPFADVSPNHSPRVDFSTYTIAAGASSPSPSRGSPRDASRALEWETTEDEGVSAGSDEEQEPPAARDRLPSILYKPAAHVTALNTPRLRPRQQIQAPGRNRAYVVTKQDLMTGMPVFYRRKSRVRNGSISSNAVEQRRGSQNNGRRGSERRDSVQQNKQPQAGPQKAQMPFADKRLRQLQRS